ncbi:hypothetical protein EO244_02270 [Ancylomarina salipaludis]|uniref:Uncharacterized protein n=1 Tax=Ancylomarina salipaludis TaxID=2501299 RepID=A0A4Q1JPU1_9BACT|nr:hypothetical protein [Ancylomarina salipaludis]RXQ96476.1 hypothetical protein EO244_02270 [Ancylomarina salipaludis]
MNSTIDELLKEAKSDGVIGMDKSESMERHHAYNRMVDLGLIKEDSDPFKKHKSARLTDQGFHAEKSGFKKWQSRKGRLNTIKAIVAIAVGVATFLAIFYDRIFPTT